MEFGINSQVAYVELEENDVNRRYILPNFERLVDKILAVISGNPKVHLIRNGFATILTGPDTDVETVSGLQAIPSTPTAMYTVRLINHAILGTADATARYSEDLAQLIGSVQPLSIPTAPVVEAIPAPAEPKIDLTAQLRAQMLATKVQELNAPKAPTEPATPSVPVSEPLPGQMKFEDFIAEKKAEKAVSKPAINKALSPQPTGKIDILMSMVSDLTEEVEELRLMLSEIRSGLGV